MDGIITNASLVQKLYKFRPDVIMALLVLSLFAGKELHFESVFFEL
jgi:hypothetical protein